MTKNSPTVELLEENIRLQQNSINICNSQIRRLVESPGHWTIHKIQQIENGKKEIEEKVDDYKRSVELLKKSD